MKKIISIVLLFFQITIVFSQNHTFDWLALTSGYDTSITTDSSNNIITISKTGGFYADKHLIEKIDSNGNILWTKTLNNTKNQEIKTDIFQNIYVYGTFSRTVDFDPSANEYNISPEIGDFFLLKLDSEGLFKWVKVFTSESGYNTKGSIFITSNTIHLSGTAYNMDLDPSNDFEANVSRNFILKLNLDGNYIEHLKINYYSSDEKLISILTDSSNNYYISSFRSSYRECKTSDPSHLCENGVYVKSSINIFITKYNSEGELIWTKNIGSDYDDYTRKGGLALTKDEEIIITGDFTGRLYLDIQGEEQSFNTSFRANFTSKIDANGNILWFYADNNFDAGYAYGVISDKDNNIYTIGDYVNNGFFIRKNNANGNIIRKHLSGSGALYQTGPWNPTNFTNAKNIVLDKDENIIYGGSALQEDDLDPSAKTYNLSSDGAFICKLKKDTSLNIIKPDNISFRVFPNPTTNILHLESSIENEIESIRVINVNGKLITNILKPDSSIDLSSLSKGIYFIKIIATQGVSQTKIVKK